MFGLLFINSPIYQTNTYSHNSNDVMKTKKKNTISCQMKTFVKNRELLFVY